MKKFAQFAQWFAIGVFLAFILMGGVISYWTRNHILSQPQLDATITTTTKSKTSENRSDSPEPSLRKWGYMDRRGRLVIPPHFDGAESFSEGIARVYTYDGEEAHIEFINREGEVICSVSQENCLVGKYTHRDFSEGLLALREEPNGKFGFVDTTGEFVIEPQFNSARNFAEGLAAVSWHDANDKLHHGFINRAGEVIIDMGDLRVRDFQQGVAVFIEPPNIFRYGLIDREGNLLMKLILAAIISSEDNNPKIEFNSERMPVKVLEPEEQTPHSIPPEWRGKWGYIDSQGNWAIEPQFTIAGEFSQGRAVIANEKENDPDWWKRGTLIDLEGHPIETDRQNPKPMLQWWKTEFHEGLAAVGAENGKSGYIDRFGKWAIEPQFDGTLNFSDGLARITVNYKDGYINWSGEVVIFPQFDSADDFQDNGLARVRVGEKSGLINRKGEYVLEPKYITISDFVDGIASIRLDDKKGAPSYFLNSDLEILFCPHWQGSVKSSEGLTPIFTNVAPQKECPIAVESVSL